MSPELEAKQLIASLRRDLARGMNADLVVKSVPGKGSVFTVILPVAGAPA